MKGTTEKFNLNTRLKGCVKHLTQKTFSFSPKLLNNKNVLVIATDNKNFHIRIPFLNTQTQVSSLVSNKEKTLSPTRV